MIQWRKEDEDNWFGEGRRYRYAVQRVSEFDQGRWELWRVDKLIALASWEKIDLIPNRTSSYDAKQLAEQMENNDAD